LGRKLEGIMILPSFPRWALSLPIGKRLFDIVVTVASSVVWFPVLCGCALAILLREGRPVVYVSRRRFYLDEATGIPKLRTMVRNAQQIANRDTVPIEGVRFLNIPLESELYTPIGRFVERFQFTELPQLFLVLLGKMTLVGNRPLPENVVRALRIEYPHCEERFMLPGGMTGPMQLVGREFLTDPDRLALEIDYCHACVADYSPRLDFMILLLTVLIHLKFIPPFTVEEVRALMRRYSGQETEDRAREAERFGRPRPQPLGGRNGVRPGQVGTDDRTGLPLPTSPSSSARDDKRFEQDRRAG
jgi:lipopolysaccharide/colanic/teichoic acid biosynthesis glycosyltransferase